ncbi:D-alanyl-lipoteichoic acid biosynthesis protein DltD [Clostridium tagluense]|uniref:D-alanyl-lipoteichoic acid biosynthesis protein DltD n=1 Tax=Clostridium tagluense TaxID=360422 RepID=UPI001C0C6451|nr:D-alanyl-lipoteichoic acid biosynthesis protein DltD [Clostridium tagluense]MBU3127263.1 D-alanyl-lipoteichoic acid biosynthesis protein DltD [Clostridium tagluense]
MKKVIALFCSIIISIVFLFCYQSHYESLISKKYYDKFGENLTANKFKSVMLQKMGAREGDNLLMFGSSEFVASNGYSTHPFKFFNGKKDGFQINLIGTSGYKCLVHVADFGALGKNLKGQKVVFVLSPQWFTKAGIDENTFEANSSELQAYGFLFNNDINLSTKEEFAKRVISITSKKPNRDFQRMRTYCSLYSNKDLLSITKRYLMTPYFWIKYELLTLKDDINSNKYLKLNTEIVKYQQPQHTNINWNEELKKAVETAKPKSNNNKFGMENHIYNSRIKGTFEKQKGSMKKDTYKVSPEYEDFKLLLDVCREEGIKPLILNIPVNGKWYDYAGFNKRDRQAYYKKIDDMVSSYDFEVADFSMHENENYFLKDASHLGWKGWVYVNEAIDKYYNEIKK